jgi:hypothetical protein
LQHRNGVRQSLFGCGSFEKSDGLSGAANEPPGTNQEINRILEKCGLVPFNCVTDELQRPAADEKRERDAPIEKEEWPRNRNHRNAKRMTELIQRVLMFGFVVSDEIHENRKS